MNALIKKMSPWADPFSVVNDLQEDINRLFSSSLRRSSTNNPGDYFPSLEVHEGLNEFRLHLDIPGIERKDMDISLTGNTLTIKGERKFEKNKEEKGYSYSERKYGTFLRSIELPAEINAEKVTASYKDGVLELVVPKSEKTFLKQRKITVE